MKKRLSELIKKSFEMIENKDYKSVIELLTAEIETYPESIELLAQIANAYYLMGEKKKSTEYYEKAFDIDNYSTIILEPLIKNQIENEKYNKAEYYANFYLKCKDKKYAVQKYLETLTDIHNFAGIENFVEKADEKDLTSDSIALISKAFIELALEQSKEARAEKYSIAKKYAQKSIESDVNNVMASCALAECYMAEKNYDMVEKLYKDTVGADSSVEFLNIYGLKKYYTEDYEAAIECFSKVSKMVENEPSVYYNLTEAYLRINWLDEAEAMVKKAIALDEKNTDYRLTLADIYYAKKESDKALLTLAFIHDLEPDNVDMNVLYTYIYSDQQDYEKASVYAKKLEGRVESSYVNQTLASIYFMQGKIDIAYKKIDELIEKEPENIQPLLMKAGFLWKERKVDEILDLYDKVIELNSNYVDAYYQKAYIYYNYKDELDKALEYAEKTVEMDCNTSEYQFLLAEVYVAMKKYDEAIGPAKVAISLTPEDIEKYSFMGYIYLKKNDVETANMYYKEILNINPQCFSEISHIARVLYGNEEIKYANDYYQKAYRINPYDYDFIREYSDFAVDKISAFKGIKILLNFSNYTENRNLKIESKNRAKRVIRENKSRLNWKEKLQLLFK